MKIIILIITIVLIILAGFIFIGQRTIEAPTDSGAVSKNDSFKEQDFDMLEQGRYEVNTDKSTVNWKGSKTFVKSWIDTGTIDISEGFAILEDGKLKENMLVINMNTIKASSTGSGSGQERLEEHLKSADFFDIENYPEAKFVAKKVLMSSNPSDVRITGDLSIKGITNEIEIPANISTSSDGYRIVGLAKIDRTLWDVRYGSGKFFSNLGDNVIDDMIEIDFDLYVNKIENDQDFEG